jgi:hypothetical protein
MERLRLQEVHFFCYHCEEFTILYFFVKMLRLGADCFFPIFMKRVRGLVVMIVACQVMDPGSIPGERNFFFWCFLFWLPCASLLLCCSTCALTCVHVRTKNQLCEKWVGDNKEKETLLRGFRVGKNLKKANVPRDVHKKTKTKIQKGIRATGVEPVT